MSRRVASIAYTPVKGTSLTQPESVDIAAGGIPHDRLFHLVDAATGRQLGASPKLLPVRSSLSPDGSELALELPGGRRVQGRVVLGEPIVGKVAWDGDRPVRSRAVAGPWSAALSDHLGQDVVLAQAVEDQRAVDVEPITLVSHASVRRAEAQLGGQRLGTARFRMNLNLDGVGEHEEDEWYGRRIAVGEAVLVVTGPVPRCAATTYAPDTGRRDAHTVKAIVQYRPPIPEPATGRPIKAPFGVYARVERPGRVAVGDALELMS